MAKGIVSILTDKIFPATAPAGNQNEKSNLKTLLFSQPITKGDADAAVNHITGKFVERQNSASKMPVGGDVEGKKSWAIFSPKFLRASRSTTTTSSAIRR